MSDDWQTPKFRQSVISKINDILQNSADPSKNAGVMENHIFKKSRSRDEYLGLVAKLFFHFKDINRKPAPQQLQNPDVGNANMMQDPINALQNLASQGTRNPQMMSMAGQPNQMPSGAPVQGNASNLLQTLNQQRPGQQQMQNMQSIRGQMNVPMGNIPQSTASGSSNMVTQMSGNMGNINPAMNINMNVMGSQPNQMGNQMGIPSQINPMTANQMQINPSLQGQAMNSLNVPQLSMNNNMNQNQMNISLNHPQLNQTMTRMNNNPSTPNVSNVVQNQSAMQNQLNVPTNIPNMPNQSQIHQSAVNPGPVGMTQNTGQINPANNLNQIISMQQQKQQNMPIGQPGNMFQVNRNTAQFLPQSPSPTVASPAGMNQPQQQQPQLPNQQMIPSPALVPSSSPQMSNVMPNNQRTMRQSPNAPLNTPGQVAASSPFNPQEDQLYREKYKQLTKYIDPLRRMVARIGNDDVDKISKMNKLLEILCNPQQRISLETLLKCEKALEKMDFKSFPPSSGNFGSTNPVLEVLSTTLQSPLANHTLYRTFHPSLESFFGTDIYLEPTPEKKIRLIKKDAQQIPHLLQGEIARLHPKFKVSIDPSSQLLNETITLICYLDDRKLPSVPPITITIPANYPYETPTCTLTDHEYSATKFLAAVQKALTTRISKFTITYTLSHLLDTWEMSVRQACCPKDLEQSGIDMLWDLEN